MRYDWALFLLGMGMVTAAIVLLLWWAWALLFAGIATMVLAVLV